MSKVEFWYTRELASSQRVNGHKDFKPEQQSSRQSVSIEQQGQARFESFSEVALFPETLGGVSTLALVPDLPRPLGNHG